MFKFLLFIISNFLVVAFLVNGAAPLGTITLASTKGDTNTCFQFMNYEQHQINVEINSDKLTGIFHLQEDFISQQHLPRTTSKVLKNRYFTNKGITTTEYQQNIDLNMSTKTLYETTTNRVSTPIEDCTSYMIELFKTNPLEKDENSSLVFKLQLPTDEERFVIKQRTRRSVGIEADGPFYVEIMFVHDYTAYKNANNDTQFLINRTRLLVNKINSVYRQHNIQISIFDIEIWTDSDRIQFTPDYDMFLERFFAYYKSQGGNFAKADHVHLLTGHETFNHGVTGLAVVGEMCSYDNSHGFTINPQSYSLNSIASLVAHELGHNLNMYHDTWFLDTYSVDCPCEEDTCIMAPSPPNPPAKYFSACSAYYLQNYLSSWKSACLRNKPLQLVGATELLVNTCGNNIVEEGEECDCGDEYFCTNPCCNPKTCLLTEDSQCFEGACCHECQIKAFGTSCRVVNDQFCDLEDFCDGKSPKCQNTFKENGTPCMGGEDGICYEGSCKSNNLRCQVFFGNATTVAPTSCFEKVNKDGGWHGHCKNDNGDHKACPEADLKCGTLHCSDERQLSEPLIGWDADYGAVAIGSEITCISPQGNLGRFDQDLCKSLFQIV